MITKTVSEDNWMSIIILDNASLIDENKNGQLE